MFNANKYRWKGENEYGRKSIDDTCIYQWKDSFGYACNHRRWLFYSKSGVSQVSYSDHKENNNAQKIEAEVSTSASILSKLLKIDLKGELSHSGNCGETENTTKEKVHTNVSLLSKFRAFLTDANILKSGFDISNMKIGDFIEVEGELQKNPLINCMDIFVDMLRMADIFAEKPQLNAKT